jgi:pilus assembly protein CpaE
MAGSEKIRVLIVDDIAETRENIRKLLQFEPDVEVVGTARTGREGIDQARELCPDVILMDINMPDMDGITATESIRRLNPYTQIVILSVQGDPNYMRRAMLAGARDFLTKPPSVDELTSATRRAGKMAQDEKAKNATVIPGSDGIIRTGLTAAAPLGRVITVYSPKGGTGCTTVAINLAVTLHNEETTVALVDGNLQFGDLAVFLNEQSKLSVTDLAPRVDELDPEILDEVMIKHATSGLRILAGPPRPEFAENVTAEQFVKIVEYLRRLYSYVIVDTSSYLTDAVLATLDISDVVVLLTTQEIPAIKNARLFLDLVDTLKIDRRRVLFSMNRHDKRIGITPEKISESFKHEILVVIPDDDRTVVPSVNRGVPFMMGDRTRPIARSILSLAEVVRQRISEFANMGEQPVAQSRKFGKR